jgi:multifunctional 2-oxoglutarate metabolism enzyme
VRLEQYYPLPIDEILAVLAQYPTAEIVWAQEEPNNMGAWPFLLQELNPLLQGRTITGVTRPASASPATGSTKRSAQEQADVISRALTV